MIVIIDYGMGNLKSVSKALYRIGEETLISSSMKDVENADKLILPGVGHFGNAVENLKSLGLWEVLNEMVVVRRKPVLGICLGMQLMARHSEEGNCNGLGWIDAEVVRFRVSDTVRFKVPHIGWNSAMAIPGFSLFDGLPESPAFYFVHSYHMKCNNPEDVVSKTIYDYPFVSSIRKENIFGVQFHPEKSHETGERLLSNFLHYK